MADQRLVQDRNTIPIDEIVSNWLFGTGHARNPEMSLRMLFEMS
jgi:hypothetical protein